MTVRSRSVAFWLVAYVFAVTMVGTTLPTPLYVVYQAQWHFSNATVTLVYAAYAGGVLLALLLAGHTSDQVGRKLVLAAAMAMSGTSTVVFIVAPGIGLLFVGRMLSGVSAGLVTGTATAALTDLAGLAAARRASLVSTAASMGGLGLGPLVAGLFAQFLPRPTTLVFEVYLFVVAMAALALLGIPETVQARRRLSLEVRGLAVPEGGRGRFTAAAVAGFASFSLLGLFSALAPSFLGSVLHEHNRAVSGAVVFCIFAVSTVTQVALAGVPAERVTRRGLAAFLAALALVVAGLSEASMAIFLIGTVVAGIATGSVFMGSLAMANELAPPERRGQVVSTYFLVAYVGLTIPVIGVGVASQHIGDFRATLTGTVVLAVLSVFAWGVLGRSSEPGLASRRVASSSGRAGDF